MANIEAAIRDWWAKNHNSEFSSENPVLRLHEPTFGPDEIVAALQQLMSTRVTMGAKVKEFERAYCAQFEFSHGVSCNSGSSANLLMLAALTNPMTKDRLNPGDEVIVPALSWSTSVWPIVQCRLVPVFVDSDPDTLNISPSRIQEAIGPRTRAVMTVPVYGNPCAMDEIVAICKRSGLTLIEDCCESMAAWFGKKPVGSFGRVASFSFYYSHHITTLEGGICVTDDFELAETMRILRAHGWIREVEDKQRWTNAYPDIDPKFLFVNAGFNIRLTEIQAVIGLQQLSKLQEFVEKRRANARYFLEALKPYSDLLRCQSATDKGTHSWFGFPIVIRESAPFDRDELCRFLNLRGIETRPIIAGNMARQPGTRLFPHRIAGDLNTADAVMKRGFTFGIHQALNAGAREHVAAAFAAFMQSKGLS